MIEFRNVSKEYQDGARKALTDFSLEIKKGEMLVLIGPSGCGKTTTLKMINRLIDPTSGTILIDGKSITDYNIHELRWNIGYVLQQIALFPHMTVEQNIKVVPELKKWGKAQTTKRAAELMEMIGLEPDLYLNRFPRELSGGQQQRIGVIRALAADPDIILMDEPFSALDPISRTQLQQDIQKLQREIHKTIVFVTHDMQEAAALGDRVCLMQDGHLIQVDTPENMLNKPANDFVREFIGVTDNPMETKIGSLANKQLADAFTHPTGEQKPFVIVIDEQEHYQHLLLNGQTVVHQAMDSETTIAQAIEQMKTIQLDYYPVIESGKLIGVLNEQILLDYLKTAYQVKDGARI